MKRLFALHLSAIALLGVPASAGAVLLAGGLAPVPGPGGCLRDGTRTDPAGKSCAQAVASLRGPAALAVSPDGRDVYVASAESDAVVALARRRDGGLAPAARPSRRACIGAGGASAADCGARTAGLAGADAVLVSPDGRNVYVGSADAGAVVAFKRRSNGLLAPLRAPAGAKGGRLRGAACLHGREVVAGAAGNCAKGLAPLQRVGALAISRDGHFLYVLSSGNQAGEDTLAALRREPDGSLTPVPGCAASHGGAGKPRCPRRATGLRGASALALSPDGRFIYVASRLSSAITGFARNRTTGALAPLSGGGACVSDPSRPPPSADRACPAHAAGLRGASSLALSPNGRLLYVGGFDPGSLAVLARDPLGGGLAPRSAMAPACLQAGPGVGCSSGLDALRGTSEILLSRAGDRLFLAAQGADAALGIPLAAGEPALPLLPFTHFGPLGAPQAIALSRDGRNLYLASPVDNEVAALGT